MKTIAIVTGASSGMGREFVRQIACHTRHIDEIWAIARRGELLVELQEEVKAVPVKALPLDICRERDLQKLNLRLMTENPRVRLLVNSAGFGMAGTFMEMKREDMENTVLVNNKALVSLTSMVLPYMQSPSNMIQMASASAFLPQKEFAVYAASKAFVLSFSRALYGELKGKGIVVTAVCPGPVDTEFLEIANRGEEPKALKKLFTVKPAPVVHKALVDAKVGRQLSIYGLPMNIVHIAGKLIPHGLFVRM